MFKEMSVSDRLVFLGRLFQSLGGSLESVGGILRSRNLPDETTMETMDDNYQENLNDEHLREK